MRWRYLSLPAMVAALAACNTLWAGNPTRTKDIGVGISAGPPTTSEIDHIIYDCEDGTRLAATFNDMAGTVTVESKPGATNTLYIAATDWGFVYMGEGFELRGKADEATWTVGNKTVKCRARAKR